MTIPFRFPGVPGVHCLFSTAHAGDMALGNDARQRAIASQNRERFMENAGFAAWAETVQVHGDVLVQARGTKGVIPADMEEADGQYTFEKGVGLVIKTADCQPILFSRGDGTAIAALHVGWRGNAMNFPGSAVKHLCRIFACGSRDLVAVRGPSLGPAAAEFVNFADEWPAGFARWFDPDRHTVDLWRLTRHQLEEAGMRTERIFSCDLCTRDTRDFFSYRRGEAGRQISVVWRD